VDKASNKSPKHYSSNFYQPGIIDSLAIAAINVYQRYLSPYKSFCCAHRVLHKGESCSQHVKRKVQKEGLMAALKDSRVRFAQCKEANQIILAQRQECLDCLASRENLAIKDRSSETSPNEVATHFLQAKKRKKILRRTKRKKNNSPWINSGSSTPSNRKSFDWSCAENGCIICAGFLTAGC
jgi:putative component of membrane protein insertase Oxa1/YidC/SpoIIIJ protein YidD